MKYSDFKQAIGGCPGAADTQSCHHGRPGPDQQIQAELARIGIALPGSLTSRTTRCQRPGCHCHATPPILHGPYPTWTRKAGARSITKTLTPQEAERLRPCFAAHRRLRQLITELEAISIELATQPAPPQAQPRTQLGDEPA